MNSVQSSPLPKMSIGKVIPENIRRRMRPEDRQAIGKPAMTNADAQAKIDGKRERELQENIAALLRQRNIWFARQRMDKRATSSLGQPDFLFSVNGKACAFEVKLPSGKLSDDQMRAIIAMNNNGWRVYVIHSEQEALQQLEAICD